MFIVLTLLKRYTHKAFYIAQCIFCAFWLLSRFDNSLMSMIDSVFPLWVIASLAALSIDKIQQFSDKRIPEADIEKQKIFTKPQ